MRRIERGAGLVAAGRSAEPLRLFRSGSGRAVVGHIGAVFRLLPRAGLLRGIRCRRSSKAFCRKGICAGTSPARPAYRQLTPWACLSGLGPNTRAPFRFCPKGVVPGAGHVRRLSNRGITTLVADLPTCHLPERRDTSGVLGRRTGQGAAGGAARRGRTRRGGAVRGGRAEFRGGSSSAR